MKEVTKDEFYGFIRKMNIMPKTSITGRNGYTIYFRHQGGLLFGKITPAKTAEGYKDRYFLK